MPLCILHHALVAELAVGLCRENRHAVVVWVDDGQGFKCALLPGFTQSAATDSTWSLTAHSSEELYIYAV